MATANIIAAHPKLSPIFVFPNSFFGIKYPLVIYRIQPSALGGRGIVLYVDFLK